MAETSPNTNATRRTFLGAAAMTAASYNRVLGANDRIGLGFIGFGLIVPFFLELKGVVKGWASRVPIIAASVFVLAGGYLLRHYFMYAGVYAYPW